MVLVDDRSVDRLKRFDVEVPLIERIFDDSGLCASSCPPPTTASFQIR
jgi:hypothetical protein